MSIWEFVGRLDVFEAEAAIVTALVGAAFFCLALACLNEARKAWQDPD